MKRGNEGSGSTSNAVPVPTTAVRGELTSPYAVAMWRRLRLSFVLKMLGLGLVTTVLVAWGCAWLMPIGMIGDRLEFSRAESPRWQIGICETFGVTQIRSMVDSSPEAVTDVRTLWWSRVRHQPPDGSVWFSAAWAVETAAGWPWPALMWKRESYYDRPAPGSAGGGGPKSQSNHWAILPYGAPIVHGSNDAVAGALPLRPLLRGLAADTLVFAAAWTLFVVGLRSRRRIRRARRGRCPGCRYDLHGLRNGRCPECGESTLDESLRHDRRVVAVTRVLLPVVAGVATTIAVAWILAATVTFDAASVRMGWLTPVPSRWLVARLDAPASTRIAWLMDRDAETVLTNEDETLRRAELREDSISSERMHKHLREQRDEVIAEQTAAAPVDARLAPAWMPAHLPRIARKNPISGLVRDARGWPLPAMWMEFQTSNADRLLRDGAAATECSFVRDGVPLGKDIVPPLHLARALPLRILWRGFMINSILYTAIWFAVFFVWSRIRRSTSAKPAVSVASNDLSPR